MSPVASYDALALMRHFSENTADVVAEAQEVLNASNKKSTAKGDLAHDENTRPDKQPRMVHISYSFNPHSVFYDAAKGQCSSYFGQFVVYWSLLCLVNSLLKVYLELKKRQHDILT